MTWETELTQLLTLTQKPGHAVAAKETAPTASLNTDVLSAEVRRRVQELGGGEILDFRLREWAIRLGMNMGPFRKFKKKASADPVLKHFEFTHRKPKKYASE